jgi:hypothetical protein
MNEFYVKSTLSIPLSHDKRAVQATKDTAMRNLGFGIVSNMLNENNFAVSTVTVEVRVNINKDNMNTEFLYSCKLNDSVITLEGVMQLCAECDYELTISPPVVYRCSNGREIQGARFLLKKCYNNRQTFEYLTIEEVMKKLMQIKAGV